MIATIIAGAVACGIASFTDVRERRVPNWLTFSTLGIALILALFGGWAHFGATVLVIAGMLALGLWLHGSGILGGGDVKLLVAVGALVGYPNCIALLLYTGIAGGLLALAVALTQGRERFVPYALAIAAGFAVLVLSFTYLPAVRLPL